jgi:serine O-acetyltransferase
MASNGNGIDAVVEALSAGGMAWQTRKECGGHLLPSRDALIGMVEDLRSVLFPGYHGACDYTEETKKYYVGSILHRVSRTLREQVKRGLCVGCAGDVPDCDARAGEITQRFLAALPEIRRLLILDVQAAYEGDPAAKSYDEPVICYPGLMAVTNQRIGHELYKLDVPLIPRIISEHAHSLTGIDIHPGARIGEKFFIDHGTGVVIGETCVIGNNVRIYQGVTLGAKSFPVDANGNPVKNIPRHPIVEDDVTIYASATILGRITIGKGSVIGGNVWLTQAVPPGSRVSVTPSPVETKVVPAP